MLHAPRQTGKTTCLFALMQFLNENGRYQCVYVNVEAAQAMREDVEQGMRSILGEISRAVKRYVGDEFPSTYLKTAFADGGYPTALANLLSAWADHCHRPLVLLGDEIDALVGDTHISERRNRRFRRFMESNSK